jgi:hypothetical protein
MKLTDVFPNWTRIKARHKGEKRVFIHNDLWQGAHRFKEIAEENEKTKSREGAAFDRMACMIMLAFAFEASINVVGQKRAKNWNERARFKKKINRVLAALEIKADFSSRPYSSIELLKEFRDLVAHGKPIEMEFNEVRELAREEVEQGIDLLAGDWEKYCKLNVVLQTYDDIDAVWKELIEKSGLPITEITTHGTRTLTLLELTDKR